jgi:trigger factor
LELRKMRAHKELHADGSDHDHQDEAHNAAHSEIDAKEVSDLPELTDEYAATLGDFKTVADLLKKVEENLKLEKDQKQKEKRRNKVLEKIVAETKGALPEVLIESESDRMLAQMKGDVAQMGGTFEEYLKYIKKTESDLRKEWYADAEKRAKIQIILNQIAKDKKIEADKELVEKEAQRLMEMYKEADRERAYEYMNQLLQNEEVLKMLEA